MTNGGDAAEQVVRLSLEGFEVAAKLSGAAANAANLPKLKRIYRTNLTDTMSRLLAAGPCSMRSIRPMLLAAISALH